MRRALIGLAIFLGLAALGGYLLFRYKTRDMILDQATVETLAARLLPGAKPLPGYQGVAAIVKDPAEVAILARSLSKAKPENLEGDDLRFVIAGLPVPKGEDSLEQLRGFVDKVTLQQEAQGLKTLEKKPGVMRMKDRPLPVLRSTVQVGEGGPKLEEVTAMFPRDGNVVLLIVSGPQASFNSAGLQTFLDGLLVEPPGRPGLGGRERVERRLEEAREKGAEVKSRAEGARERAAEAKHQAEAARQRAEQAEERAEQARERLREAREVRGDVQERREERRERRGGPLRP